MLPPETALSGANFLLRTKTLASTYELDSNIFGFLTNKSPANVLFKGETEFGCSFSSLR